MRLLPFADGQDRGGAGRRSREPIPSFDSRLGDYLPVDLNERSGPVDVRTLPVTAFGTLGPAEPGLKRVHTVI